MPMKMRLFWMALSFLAILMVAPVAGADEDKTFFYNITTEDTWRAGMAIGQATKAMEEGYDVVLFLNVQGTRLAAKDSEQDIFGPTGKTPRAMLRHAADEGAKVVMCPMCLKRAGLEMDDIIDVAERGGPEVTFDLMAADDTVVMSY